MVQTGDASSQKTLCCSTGEIKTVIYLGLLVQGQPWYAYISLFANSGEVSQGHRQLCYENVSFERRVDAGIALI